jgi:hypothetical protein
MDTARCSNWVEIEGANHTNVTIEVTVIWDKFESLGLGKWESGWQHNWGWGGWGSHC